MHTSRVWTHTMSLNLLHHSDPAFQKLCTLERIHGGLQGQHGISQTWHWRKHCAAGGAAPQGCRLCSPSVGSDAAPQKQLLDYLHSLSLELSCLHNSHKFARAVYLPSPYCFSASYPCPTSSVKLYVLTVCMSKAYAEAPALLQHLLGMIAEAGGQSMLPP